ncbi:S8 family serine peptidase [Colwellia psychrerythraea]|uniref:Thermostable serine protease, subtilase family n=1 Tax=Colwellia psychrerythraea (strain 34H / ATCC BAA-681) TaxID=167879 RepID=Q488H8_COLP3|nr:S8 family serine peptidase [Colwellia psychrerythraea]AAZ28353.1 thermostable serine protease, subtilase family [Colwellia psychrerythraea 34H]
MKYVSNNQIEISSLIKRQSKSFVLGSLLLPLTFSNFAIANPPEHSAAFAKGQILVQPQPGLSEQNFQKILGKHKASSKGKLHQLRTHIINVPANAEQAIVKALSNNPNIEFAEVDILVKPSEIIANDTYYNNAWHLNKMQLPTAWETAKGNGVVVAILDTGVNSNHTDLSANMIAGWNSVSRNSETSDIYGHGTKVAGVVAAISDNNNGVTSIAWHASIMPIRITNDSSGYAYWSDIANGLTWAADNGADIANISYQVTTSSSVTNAAQYMRSKGGLVVASAGNSGADLNCTDNPSIITVSATDSADNKASWSDYGNCIDVSAPGSGIWTTTKSGGYGAVNGTSFASPATAATLALIKSANLNLSNDELENILEASADKSKNGGVFNSYYGHGRIDAAAAVAMVVNTPTIDQQAPTVVITSPTENSVQTGTFNITANAQDNMAVSSVSLYANGVLIGTDTVAPFSANFNSNNIADGNVAFTAQAYDATGNQGNSSTYWLTIDNIVDVADTIAPSVSITNLVNGSSISGNQAIKVSATDNTAVTKIELYIDGQLKTQTTESILSYSWNTRKVANGYHTIVTKAFDAAGNQNQTSIQVNVQARKKGRK